MTARLTAVGRPVVEQILDETYPLWGGNLTRRAYGQYHDALARTPWGDRLRRVALVDGDVILSSARRYDLQATLDARPIRVVGIGSVFTPVALRRRGHAGRLIEEIARESAEDGADLALLFSDIGTVFYERLGFSAVPLEESIVEVVRTPGAPGLPVRAGEDRDLPWLAELPLQPACRFGLARTADWLRFLLARCRLLVGLGPPGVRGCLFFVAEDGGRPSAFVLITATANYWGIEACGDRDPTGARVGAILEALLAGEPRQVPPVIRAWLPSGWLPPQLTVRSRRPTRIVMMIRNLRPHTHPIDPPLGPGEVGYWRGEVV